MVGFQKVSVSQVVEKGDDQVDIQVVKHHWLCHETLEILPVWKGC